MANQLIIFSIQRLDFLNNIKNNSYIIFDEILDLKSLADENLNGLKLNYRLYAIIEYNGDINTGHYYSIIRRENKWVLFND